MTFRNAATMDPSRPIEYYFLQVRASARRSAARRSISRVSARSAGPGAWSPCSEPCWPSCCQAVQRQIRESPNSKLPFHPPRHWET